MAVPGVRWGRSEREKLMTITVEQMKTEFGAKVRQLVLSIENERRIVDEHLDQAQAEIERLKAERDLARKHAFLCADELGQAQARGKRLEAVLRGVWVFLCNDIDLRGNEVVKTDIETALAEGDTNEPR